MGCEKLWMDAYADRMKLLTANSLFSRNLQSQSRHEAQIIQPQIYQSATINHLWDYTLQRSVHYMYQYFTCGLLSDILHLDHCWRSKSSRPPETAHECTRWTTAPCHICFETKTLIHHGLPAIWWNNVVNVYSPLSLMFINAHQKCSILAYILRDSPVLDSRNAWDTCCFGFLFYIHMYAEFALQSSSYVRYVLGLQRALRREDRGTVNYPNDHDVW